MIRLRPGFTQQQLAGDVVSTQLDELRRALDDLLRLEALELR